MTNFYFSHKKDQNQNCGNSPTLIKNQDQGLKTRLFKKKSKNLNPLQKDQACENLIDGQSRAQEKTPQKTKTNPTPT